MHKPSSELSRTRLWRLARINEPTRKSTAGKNQKGFGLVESLLVILILSVVGFGGYYIWRGHHKTNPSTNSLTNSQLSKSDLSVQTTRYSKVPADLQTAIVAHVTQSGGQTCYHDGSFYTEDGKVNDPQVYYVASGYAISVSCASQELYAKTANQWQFLAATQMMFECDTLHQFKVPVSLLAIGSDGTVQCDSNGAVETYN